MCFPVSESSRKESVTQQCKDEMMGRGCDRLQHQQEGDDEFGRRTILLSEVEAILARWGSTAAEAASK